MSLQRVYSCLQQILFFLPICLILLPISASPTYSKRQDSEDQPSSSAPSLLRRQFTNPSEVLTVVLIIGGDIVQKAIAQMCGRTITPVAFSFGWVSYAFNSLMSAFGDGVLMPNPDFPAFVVTVSSGGRKANESWMLSRLIRDLVKEEEKHLKSWKDADGNYQSEGDSGLIITIYEVENGAGSVKWDILSWSYFVTLFLQLGLAAIPIGVDGNWIVMLITAAGSGLALITGSLPEWKHEKFAGRKESKDTYALTRGNGHKHVFVIQNPWNTDGKPEHANLYLEDLAGSVRGADHFTRMIILILAVLWIMLLITVGSISSSSDTWYLLGVGALGMVQNVLVAGSSRESSAHGIPIHVVKANPDLGIADGRQLGRRTEDMKRRPKVMNVLYDAEDAYPGLGLSLKDLFFPVGQLTESEIVKWKDYATSLGARKTNKREEYRKKLAALSTKAAEQPEDKVDGPNGNTSRSRVMSA